MDCLLALIDLPGITRNTLASRNHGSRQMRTWHLPRVLPVSCVGFTTLCNEASFGSSSDLEWTFLDTTMLQATLFATFPLIIRVAFRRLSAPAKGSAIHSSILPRPS